MKSLFLAAFILLSLVNITGCKKTEKNYCHGLAEYSGNMQVIKDCTGTYLRYNQKDYLVCNNSTLSGYSSGTRISAAFNKIAACGTPAQGICNMYHPYEGYAQIVCLRPVITKE